MSLGLNSTAPRQGYLHTGLKHGERQEILQESLLSTNYTKYSTGLNAKMLQSLALAIQTKFCCAQRERERGREKDNHKMSRRERDDEVVTVSLRGSLEIHNWRKPGEYSIDWE